MFFGVFISHFRHCIFSSRTTCHLPVYLFSFSLPEACLLCLFGWFYLQIVTWATAVDSNKSKSSTLGHALSSSPLSSLSFPLLSPLNASSVHPFSFRLPFMPIIGIADFVFFFIFIALNYRVFVSFAAKNPFNLSRRYPPLDWFIFPKIYFSNFDDLRFSLF